MPSTNSRVDYPYWLDIVERPPDQHFSGWNEFEGHIEFLENLSELLEAAGL